MQINVETVLAAGLLSNVAIEFIKVFVTKPSIDAKLDQLNSAINNATASITGQRKTPPSS